MLTTNSREILKHERVKQKDGDPSCGLAGKIRKVGARSGVQEINSDKCLSGGSRQ